MTSTVTLEELAQAADTKPNRIIERLLERLESHPDDRAAFLHGLSERLVRLRTDPDDGVDELHRWIGSWWISLDLREDPDFHAADDEAQRLIEAGELSEGVTGKELRARYRKRARGRQR